MGTITDVLLYFGLTAEEFAPMWRALTPVEREEIKTAVGHFDRERKSVTGKLTY